jgi:hypothetical protein
MTALVQGHFGLSRRLVGLDPFQKAAIGQAALLDRGLGPDNRGCGRFYHCDQSVFGLGWHPPEIKHLESRPQVQNARDPIRIDRIDTRKVGQQPIVFAHATHTTPHNVRLSRISFPTLSRWRHDCGKFWMLCGYPVAVATGAA